MQTELLMKLLVFENKMPISQWQDVSLHAQLVWARETRNNRTIGDMLNTQLDKFICS